jgi:LytS/YehU family sensor histidine kinase
VNRVDHAVNDASETSTGFFSSHFNSYFRNNILTNVSIVILALAYRLLLFWLEQEKIRKELENQKLRAELSFLKMQVNPHFLFNALNNIYALAVLENGKKTSDSILKLSDLLRYVLYEKEDEDHKVGLQKEITHINNYIDLERLRHPERIHIIFSVEGAIEDKRIAPLLLFPLIENAFKHGILTDPQKPVGIDIKVSQGFLDFSVRNFKNSYSKDETGGIGLQNVRKRLDLLYGDTCTIDIKDKPDRFFVNLHLPL